MQSRWTYAAIAGGIVDATAVTVKAADPGNWINEVERLDVINVSATISTEFVLMSGSTVLWRTNLQSAMKTPLTLDFLPPLRMVLNTDPVRIQCITTGAQVYANVQGVVCS
jgi:hypothetical protein